MTLEEKAEKSFEKARKRDIGLSYGSYCDGYIAGVTENCIVWHDLRKNPDDVPEDDREVLNEIGIEVRYIGDCWIYVYIEETTNADVVAWCEIPEFNEK